MAWIGAGALLAALVAAGFAVGSALSDDSSAQSSSSPSERTLASAGVKAKAPAGWTEATSPIRGLGDGTAAVAAGGNPKRGAFVAGSATGSWPTYLSAALLRSLPATSTLVRRRDIVELSGTQAYRYRRVRMRDGRLLTVFVAPRNPKGQVVACVGPGASSLMRTCEKAMASATIRAGKAWALPPARDVARSLRRTIAPLNRARSSGAADLRAADTPSAQATAASAVTAAYRTAERRIAPAAAPPVARPPMIELRRALKRAGTSYAALASAARNGRETAYDRARTRITATEAETRAAITSLSQIGYVLPS